MDQTALCFAEQVRFQVLLDVACAKKEKRFGNRMKCHVEEHTQKAQGPSEAERQHHDPAMVNARVGQQAPKALLDKDKRNGDSHRKESEDNQKLRAKLRAQTF